MPSTRPRPWLVALVGLAGLLAAVAAAAGVLLRGDLATVPFTTVRGDPVEVLVAGTYRFNGVAIAAEGVGWDLVTLLAAVPALALGLPALARGSVRARLVVVGLLAYLLYQYAEYAMALAYGPLFLLYVAIAGLSASLVGVLVVGMDRATLAATVGGRTFPRRGVAAFGGFVALLLAGMWLPLVARTATAVSVPELAGGTTLVVQAFDLGFLVPLGTLTAVASWRRLPAGAVLAPVLAVKGGAMGAAIAAMLIVEAAVTGVAQPVPIAGFALISVVSLLLARRVVRSVEEPRPAGSAGVAPGAPPVAAQA